MYTAQQLRDILGKPKDLAFDPDAFVYVETEHPCPECGQGLRRVVPSTMVVCVEEHGPYFLT